MSPRSVVQVTAADAASRVASSSLPRATPRSIDPSTRLRPASTRSGDPSWATTRRPLRAATSTMPLPIVPIPITPIVPMSMSGAPVACAPAASARVPVLRSWRDSDASQSDSAIVTELMVTSVSGRSLRSVLTLCMASTTSSPRTTLPNSEY